MADEQYDVSEKMKKLFAIKQKQRQEAKAFYLKAMTNPHRGVDEPPPFDPVFFRYSSLKSYAHEHFRPNPKNLLLVGCFFSLPIVALAIYKINFREKREKLLRSGEVAYKDRLFRLFY